MSRAKQSKRARFALRMKVCRQAASRIRTQFGFQLFPYQIETLNEMADLGTVKLRLSIHRTGTNTLQQVLRDIELIRNLGRKEG